MTAGEITDAVLFRVKYLVKRPFEHFYWYHEDERRGFVWTIGGRTYNGYVAFGPNKAAKFHIAVGFRFKDWPPR